MNLPYIPPYKTKMVEPVYFSSKEERINWIKHADYNLFKLDSDWVIIDLMTDSGTGAMSEQQWAEVMLGDESYAGSESYYKLARTVEEIMGFPHMVPTHQGRAAENILFSATVKEGDIIPGNAHFDTTKGHIEFRKAHAVDCTIDAAFDTTIEHPFKGNVDLDKLKKILDEHPREKIPFINLTITCNTVGGQPVSLENIKAVKALADDYGIPVYMDIARYAENAYFIKKREAAYKDKSIQEIVHETFACCDTCWMSSKKDGLANMGGLIATKNEELFTTISNLTIIYEGFITYGGMSGRDMGALAVGLREALEFDYLESRVEQVQYLGEKLMEYGVPIQTPVGGHAIFIDALRFFPNVPQAQYPGQLLAVESYIEGGVRGTEIGTLLADRDPATGLDRYPELDTLRFAIPRRVYSRNHMDYVAATMRNVFERRNQYTKGFKIKWQAPILRHFTVKLERNV
ncbi:MAG: tryptophanase [Saprospiraceae bacterium]|nr:tryptophanase [Saprospiraceae bacterium]